MDHTRQLDLLADMIAASHIGTTYGRSWHDGPMALQFAARESFGFHVVISGEVWLLARGERHLLRSGDVVMLSCEHVLATDPELKPVPFVEEDVLANAAPEGEGVCLLCGAYLVEDMLEHPIFANLPPLVLLSVNDRSPSVDGLVTLLDHELRSQRPGTRTIVNRLVDAMLVQILRHWIESGCPQARGWIGALQDPILGRVLALIHNDYDAGWTLESLARAAGTSRSTLARNFSAAVGTSPMSFLTRRRLEVARDLLARGTMRLDEIADEVGYATSFALSKAYKREFGVAPMHSAAAPRRRRA